MEQLVMEVRDFKSINNAKIEINKINVIAGVNGCGKSSLSRVFYSFLMGNSIKRNEFVLKKCIEVINDTIEFLDYEGNDYGLPKPLDNDSNFENIKNTFEFILNISRKHDKIAHMKSIELIKPILHKLKLFCEKLDGDGIDIYEKIKEYNKSLIKKDDFDEYVSYVVDFVENKNFEDEFDMALIENKIDMILYGSDEKERIEAHDVYNKYNLKALEIGIYISSLLGQVFYPIIKDNLPDDIIEDVEIILFDDKYSRPYLGLDNDVAKKLLQYDKEVSDKKMANALDEDMRANILQYSEIYNILNKRNYFSVHDDTLIYCRDIFRLIENFEDQSADLSKLCYQELFTQEFHEYYIKKEINFNLNASEWDIFQYFIDIGFVNSAYYVDSVSILNLGFKRYPARISFHIKEIIEDLQEKGEKNDVEISNDINCILEKVDMIIKGKFDNRLGFNFKSDKQTDYKDYDYKLRKFSNSKRNISTRIINTPSGIKQIGIIQLLLRYNKLHKDGFLIIDEPEVNLHPEWQFKFAEILVLLAKELNITVYLNSHSPFFIEAIDAFTEFYDMKDDVNYYLAEETDTEGKYDFNRISSNELYMIYDNLGNPYDLIDQLRLKKHLGE